MFSFPAGDLPQERTERSDFTLLHHEHESCDLVVFEAWGAGAGPRFRTRSYTVIKGSVFYGTFRALSRVLTVAQRDRDKFPWQEVTAALSCFQYHNAKLLNIAFCV